MLMCLIIPPNPPVTLSDVLTMKARGLEPTMLEVSRISHFTCAKNKKRLCHFCCHVRASSGIDANWHVVRHCFWLRLSYLKIELDPSLHCRCNEFKSRIELESNWATQVSLKATIAFVIFVRESWIYNCPIHLREESIWQIKWVYMVSGGKSATRWNQLIGTVECVPIFFKEVRAYLLFRQYRTQPE